jgi:Glycosyl hydrolase family 63 C-terminal domain
MRERRLFSIVDGDQLKRILHLMLDENEFLSSYGIRAVSHYHKEHPYTLEIGGIRHSVSYEPGESSTGLFGGNSNWRGPIWMPVNYLLIAALRRFHQYYGDEFRVECPTGSGQMKNLAEVADEVSSRLVNIFRTDASGGRPVHSRWPKFAQDPHWRDLVSFHEYFHGDSGAGVGASHQTGWTALVANLISELAESKDRPAMAVAVTTSKEN